MDDPVESSRRSPAILVALAIVGAVSLAAWGLRHTHDLYLKFFPGDRATSLPAGRLPGPPRTETPEFKLGPGNAQRMIGTDDPRHERWADIAGNYYSVELISHFSYTGQGADDPQAWLRVDPEGDTLRGRLEARGLKPNFAYQVKLRGLWSDRAAFEHIGYLGRWRLPGPATNFSDRDYEQYDDKAAVEAYVLFDFFVTDAAGRAVRDFALDSSLHVLWHYSRRAGAAPGDCLPVVVDASDPIVYARPKTGQGRLVWLWAERERRRQVTRDQVMRLPPGDYNAEIVLTEESFHARDVDGGWWATVMRAPIHFRIVVAPGP